MKKLLVRITVFVFLASLVFAAAQAQGQTADRDVDYPHPRQFASTPKIVYLAHGWGGQTSLVEKPENPGPDLPVLLFATKSTRIFSADTAADHRVVGLPVIGGVAAVGDAGIDGIAVL